MGNAKMQVCHPEILSEILFAPSLVGLLVSSLHPAARLEPPLQLSTVQHYITRLHHTPPLSHFAVSPP